VLVVLTRDDDVTARSLSNLPHVVALPGDQLTAFDVLSADVIVFTDETLPGANANGPAAVLVDEVEPEEAEPVVAAPARTRARAAAKPVEAVAAEAEPVDAAAGAVEPAEAAADEIETETAEPETAETATAETEKDDDSE
jgi:hypothetical protein